MDNETKSRLGMVLLGFGVGIVGGMLIMHLFAATEQSAYLLIGAFVPIVIVWFGLWLDYRARDATNAH